MSRSSMPLLALARIPWTPDPRACLQCGRIVRSGSLHDTRLVQGVTYHAVAELTTPVTITNQNNAVCATAVTILLLQLRVPQVLFCERLLAQALPAAAAGLPSTTVSRIQRKGCCEKEIALYSELGRTCIVSILRREKYGLLRARTKFGTSWPC